ncbi:MAG: two-component system sensor kinase ParS [Cognaticolwellia sp.]|jgi:two-component system sensor kinase ParS
MKRFFAKLMLAALLSLVAAQALAHQAGQLAKDRQHRPRQRQLLVPKLMVAAEHLDPLTPTMRERALRSYGHTLAMRLELSPAPATGATQYVRLQDGSYLWGSTGKPPVRWDTVLVDLLLSILAFAAVLLIFGRPLVRDLYEIDRTTQRLTAGDLGARTRLVDGPIGAVGARFDAMAERLESTVTGQQELLQAVSHELRTPQARMRFQLEALASAPEAQREKWIRALDSELEWSDVLLGKLLDLLRSDTVGGAPMAPGETTRLVREIVQGMALMTSHELRVKGEGDLDLEATELRRILENLLSNAIRHTRSVVQVRLASGLLVVEDNGPGIPVAERARIFEPFVTLDRSRSRELGGVGLGLALVQRSADRAGARISLVDGELGGACVQLSWDS